MKFFVLLFILFNFQIASAYNIKLFDAKPFSLKDKAFYYESCPRNDKGEGYCNKDYNSYIRLRFLYRHLSELDDWPGPYSGLPTELKKMYPTDFTLYDKGLKPALVYNESGIFFRGKKLCDLLKPWRIPHLNNKLCPAALGELPFRFTADIDGTVSDFEILLKEYDEKKNSGWTMFRGEKLFFNPPQKGDFEEEYKQPQDVIYKGRALFPIDKLTDLKMLAFIKKIRAIIKEKDLKKIFFTSPVEQLGEYRFFLNSSKNLYDVSKTNDYIFDLLYECTKGNFQFYEDKKDGSMVLTKGFFATGTGLESKHPIYMSCKFVRDDNGKYNFNLWITDEYSQGSNYSFSIRY